MRQGVCNGTVSVLSHLSTAAAAYGGLLLSLWPDRQAISNLSMDVGDRRAPQQHGSNASSVVLSAAVGV